ncbi:hypothetical protein [Burkholderia ubonensis]|uniref:hypothetical protein n=1 Tax=Burkholderia ubonensis TaxID=101571 RepID=UPI000B1060A3|nr:hypothetical protein [Burkholderia ubonensis]
MKLEVERKPDLAEPTPAQIKRALRSLKKLFLAFHANAPFPDFVRWRPAPGF